MKYEYRVFVLHSADPENGFPNPTPESIPLMPPASLKRAKIQLQRTKDTIAHRDLKVDEVKIQRRAIPDWEDFES